MGKLFLVFDTEIDPEQKHCLYSKNGVCFISSRNQRTNPLCEHRFYDVDKLIKWYSIEWSPELKAICPTCANGYKNENEKKKVLIAVPHANCKDLTFPEKAEHFCDFDAKGVAQLFDKEFKKRGYQTVLIDDARRRIEYDENRPQHMDSEMRKEIKSSLANEDFGFALEVHSYPPTEILTKNLDFYILDNFMDHDNPVTNRTKTFVQLTENSGIDIRLLHGDKEKNYLQNLFRSHRVDSFLLEANEGRQSERFIEIMTENLIRIFMNQ